MTTTNPLPKNTKGLFICVDTGEVAKPKIDTKGSFLIELVLWLCFIVPGLIYSIWRHTTRAPAIKGNRNIVPLDSPRGRKLYAELHQATT